MTELMSAIVLNFLIGILLLLFGRRFSRQGDWLVVLGLLFLEVTCGINWKIRGYVLMGWIGKWNELKTAHVGLMLDPLGLAMTMLAGGIGLLIIFNRNLFQKVPRIDRVFSAVAICSAGISLAWLSLTPWLALLGISLIIFGGFVSMGGRWDEGDREALFTFRGTLEGFWGLLLGLMGTAMLASSELIINWNQQVFWSANPKIIYAAVFLVTGAFLFFRPFPFLGWTLMPSRVSFLIRVLLSSLLLGWAAFAVLIRMEPRLRMIGVFPAFGWAAFGAAFFSAVCGFFQEDWHKAVLLWLSTAFSLSTAALAFAGSTTGFSIMIGLSLGMTALAFFGVIVNEGSSRSTTARKKNLWAKTGLFISAFCASGFIGFISCGAGVGWLGKIQEDITQVVCLAIALFSLAYSAWRIAWMAGVIRKFTDINWFSIFMPYLLLICSLGVFWTGALGGGVAPDFRSPLFASLLTLFFQEGGFFSGVVDEHRYYLALGIYFGPILLGMIAARWMRSRKTTYISPGIAKFFAESFYIDTIMNSFLGYLIAIERRIEFILSHSVWEKWINRISVTTLGKASRASASFDSVVSGYQLNFTRKIVYLPAKVVQLMQNGDLQWYLFWVIGIAAALLVRFLVI